MWVNSACVHSLARNWQLPSRRSRREKMITENILWSISRKLCCRAGTLLTCWMCIRLSNQDQQWTTSADPDPIIKAIAESGSLDQIKISVFVCFIQALSLSTSFQSYPDSVWMWQGAQCSLLECCLTEISCPRKLTWYSTQSHYTDTELTSSDS